MGIQMKTLHLTSIHFSWSTVHGVKKLRENDEFLLIIWILLSSPELLSVGAEILHEVAECTSKVSVFYLWNLCINKKMKSGGCNSVMKFYMQPSVTKEIRLHS